MEIQETALLLHEDVAINWIGAQRIEIRRSGMSQSILFVDDFSCKMLSDIIYREKVRVHG